MLSKILAFIAGIFVVRVVVVVVVVVVVAVVVVVVVKITEEQIDDFGVKGALRFLRAKITFSHDRVGEFVPPAEQQATAHELLRHYVGYNGRSYISSTRIATKLINP